MHGDLRRFKVDEDYTFSHNLTRRWVVDSSLIRRHSAGIVKGEGMSLASYGLASNGAPDLDGSTMQPFERVDADSRALGLC
jgi:hypothetical protein